MIKIKSLKPNSQEMHEFTENSIVLGRDQDCNLSLDDHTCSRYHARIECTGKEFKIIDLDSTNGIRVNGCPVKHSSLKHGDHFSIGREEFVFFGRVAESSEPSSDTLIEDSISLDEADRLFGNITSLDPNNRSRLQEKDLKELAQAHQALNVAYKVSQAINSTLQTEDLYNLITESIFEHCRNADRVCLFHREEGRTELALVSKKSNAETENIPVSRSILNRVEKERVGILASDASEDARFVNSLSVAISDIHSMICVPLATKKSFLGAIYLDNVSIVDCFEKTDLELLTLIGNQVAFAIENSILYKNLQVSFYETIRSLSNALEAKDPYTRGHSDRVASYAVGVALGVGLEPERVKWLRIAAELHDIGKIAIRESIIGKSSKLTAEEYEKIKKHPQLGVDILKPIRFLEPVFPFILHHHERFDGTGYPNGLRGTAAPLEARIINLADAFDAMTTQRSYNQPRSFEDALKHCKKEAGVSFDADLVTALVDYVQSEVKDTPTDAIISATEKMLQESFREVNADHPGCSPGRTAT